MLDFKTPLFDFNHFILYTLLICLLFIIGHLIYLEGGQNMKNSIICATPYEIQQWDNALAITQNVCVDIQLSQFKEMKDINSKEVQRWKDNYTWLKLECNERNEKVIEEE